MRRVVALTAAMRFDVVTIALNAVPAVVASFLATRWPRPVTAERWVLVAGPVALGAGALVTPSADAVVWAQLVGNLLGLLATVVLVRSVQSDMPAGTRSSPSDR